MLRDSAARLLKERISGTLIKDLLKEDKGYAESLWKEMAELGWFGLIYDEQYGGSGMSFSDLCFLFEEIGKSGLASPFFTSVILSGMVINEAGDEDLKEACLPAIADGSKIWTLALRNGHGQDDHAAPALMAKEEDGALAVSGTRVLVPYAHVADEIIVCAALDSAKGKGPTLIKIEGAAAGP